MIIIKESNLPDWQDTIMIEIRNILKNNRIYADIYDDTDFRGNDDAFVLCAEIENGDWKHEHKRADILITDTVNHYDNMEITKIGEETIGDNEDDTYSSIHRFHILRYPDDNDFDFDFDDIEQLDIEFPKRESVKRKNRKSIKESIDLTDYKFKFSTKDGYKVYSKFDKSLNKGLWVAQKEGEEPFEISYEQARGFEPINPTDKALQHKLRKALKRESATNKDTEPYGRYMVKFTPYKNMYKFDYIDNYSDASNYCFFDNMGYVNTAYSGIRKQLFDKLYDEDMKPNKVYEIYTDGIFGDVLYYEEVPSHWFHL